MSNVSAENKRAQANIRIAWKFVYISAFMKHYIYVQQISTLIPCILTAPTLPATEAYFYMDITCTVITMASEKRIQCPIKL